jgi:hypothetical protein
LSQASFLEGKIQMKKLLLFTAAILPLATAGAKADVILDPHLSGTGDNVVFDSFSGSTAIGRFNGMNQGIVDFTDLSGNPAFIGAANGNDIKISNTNDLQITVFNNAGTQVLDTSTQVFSLKGSGDVVAFVQATDGLFTFDLGTINGAQSGFTLTAFNNETMSQLTLVDTGGTITDYEHYRIDVAAAVPGPIVGAGFPGAAFASLGMLWFQRNRKRRFAA